ncbi:MAG: hypothetical protein VX899_18090 [Myxococcota bacterium]|nr:hypothetical protein [Myxococcota bacterium]
MSKNTSWGLVLLGAGVLALPCIFLVPYYRSVTQEYGRFHEYMEATVDNTETPVEWTQRPFSPVECVDFGVAWSEACPATKEFCHGALYSVVGRCVESQDRQDYCASLDREWMTTGFGYHDCENRLTELPEDASAQRKKREKACAAGYRSIADHCRDLELAANP